MCWVLWKPSVSINKLVAFAFYVNGIKILSTLMKGKKNKRRNEASTVYIQTYSFNYYNFLEDFHFRQNFIVEIKAFVHSREPRMLEILIFQIAPVSCIAAVESWRHSNSQ